MALHSFVGPWPLLQFRNLFSQTTPRTSYQECQTAYMWKDISPAPAQISCYKMYRLSPLQQPHSEITLHCAETSLLQHAYATEVVINRSSRVSGRGLITSHGTNRMARGMQQFSCSRRGVKSYPSLSAVPAYRWSHREEKKVEGRMKGWWPIPAKRNVTGYSMLMS
jgi:hypothetical protein